jgi:hypothetical protein
MHDTIEKITPELVSNVVDEEFKGKAQDTTLSEPILCCYVNTTGRIQMGRLSHLPEGEWEHIFFPGQHFMFEAPPEANLVIYKSPSLSMTVPDYILCDTLQVSSN